MPPNARQGKQTMALVTQRCVCARVLCCLDWCSVRSVLGCRASCPIWLQGHVGARARAHVGARACVCVCVFAEGGRGAVRALKRRALCVGVWATVCAPPTQTGAAGSGVALGAQSEYLAVLFAVVCVHALCASSVALVLACVCATRQPLTPSPWLWRRGQLDLAMRMLYAMCAGMRSVLSNCCCLDCHSQPPCSSGAHVQLNGAMRAQTRRFCCCCSCNRALALVGGSTPPLPCWRLAHCSGVWAR
jgi:hypothetical protein